MDCPGLIGRIAGNIPKVRGLLGPADVVTVTLVRPGVVPFRKLNVAVAEMEFKTLTFVAVTPLPTYTVNGAPNRDPENVTGILAPGTPKGGVRPLNAGRTLIEIV
jgi:hypothetical protein